MSEPPKINPEYTTIVNDALRRHGIGAEQLRFENREGHLYMVSNEAIEGRVHPWTGTDEEIRDAAERYAKSMKALVDSGDIKPL